MASRRIGVALGWTRAATIGVVRYLHESGKLRFAGLGGKVSLTVDGVDSVESADDPAPAPPPVGGLNVNADRGAIVQIAPHGSAEASPGSGNFSVAPSAADTSRGGPESTGRRMTTRVVGFGVAVLASLVAAVIWWAVGPDGTDRRGVDITLSNQVTNGPTMREDDSPLVLAYEPTLECVRRPNCLVDQPTFATGDHLRVVCQTVRDRMTNGDDSSPADDDNRDLADSRLWYGTELDGDIVYVNEVYVAAGDRGWRDLPTCSRG